MANYIIVLKEITGQSESGYMENEQIFEMVGNHKAIMDSCDFIKNLLDRQNMGPQEIPIKKKEA